MSRQLKFGFMGAKKSEHGGEKSRGKRKRGRPVDPKRAVHLTLRASQASGKWSLLHPDHCRPVEKLVRAVAEKRAVRLFRYANVGNHLHLLVKVPSKAAFQAFLREISGSVALLVTGAQKGRALGKRFWDDLAWSRIVEWGRDFKGVELYIIGNLLEAAGLYTKEDKKAGRKLLRFKFEDPPPMGWEEALA